MCKHEHLVLYGDGCIPYPVECLNDECGRIFSLDELRELKDIKTLLIHETIFVKTNKEN